MDVADAYSRTGGRWERGAGRVYNRLAEAVVECSPAPVAGQLALDVGAGTGAATRALRRGGARVVAADVAVGMLRAGLGGGAAPVVADARVLPFRGGTFGVVVAAFSLNHVPDPDRGLAEAARVCVPGGGIVAASYAHDDTHPVKGVVEAVLREAGWSPGAWYEDVKSRTAPLLATVEGNERAARAAGLRAFEVHPLRIEFPELRPQDLVEWRFGMAQHAPFVATLDAAATRALRARALDLLGDDPPVLCRSILVLTATA